MPLLEKNNSVFEIFLKGNSDPLNTWIIGLSKWYQFVVSNWYQ